MYDIVLEAGGVLPDYLSILPNGNGSPFSDDEFQFTDPGLNGLVLDPHRLRMEMEGTTLQVCHPCNMYLPRSVIPQYALANKLYRGRLPEEFQDLTSIEVCDILQHSGCHSDLPILRPIAARSVPQKYLCARDECGLDSGRAPPPSRREQSLERCVYRAIEVQTQVPWNYVQSP